MPRRNRNAGPRYRPEPEEIVPAAVEFPKPRAPDPVPAKASRLMSCPSCTLGWYHVHGDGARIEGYCEACGYEDLRVLAA